ncbi:MAG: HAD family phosphatase [Bryobacterales bacterium]
MSSDPYMRTDRIVCPTAFYDFDGTLVSSNVVTRYAFFAKNHPAKLQAAWRYAKVVAGVPVWLGLDAISRRLFNEIFFRQYRGLGRDWLIAQSEKLYEHEILPKLFAGTRQLLEADRAQGHRLVLVSGGFDFDLAPFVREFGFDDLISNQLEFENGVATGRVIEPLLAEQEKVNAIRRYCAEYNVDAARAKAYSDSFSDLPMLEVVGSPAAVNPDRRLRRIAIERGWPVLNLRDREAVPLG